MDNLLYVHFHIGMVEFGQTISSFFFSSFSKCWVTSWLTLVPTVAVDLGRVGVLDKWVLRKKFFRSREGTTTREYVLASRGSLKLISASTHTHTHY